MTQPAEAIVVVGSINVDLIVGVDRWLDPGETVLGRSFDVSPGGKGANQAAAAARLGGSVAMIGAVGDDEYRATALRGLTDAGVRLDAVTRAAEARTGVALITVGPGGDNTIVVIAGANALMGADAVAARAELIGAAAVVVVQGEIPRDGVEAAAALTRGRLIVNLAPAVAIDPQVVRRADPLVVNEHEGAAALALLGGEPDPDEPDPEAAIVRGLLAAGVASAVVTRGERGCVVGSRGPDGAVRVDAVAALPVTAVDTTGAGDAFVGAIAVALTRGDGLEAAARFATRVAAYSVQRAGAQTSYPDGADRL